MVFKIGHRGAAGYEPENTFSSFLTALELGANMVELDVRRTKDGKIVVIHDACVDRTTNGTGLVRDLTLEELGEFDVGKGKKIPILSNILDLFAPHLVINVELKEEGMAGEVLRLIQTYRRVDRVIVSAFDDEESGYTSNWVDLLWLKRKESGIKIGLLARDYPHIWRSLELASAYDIYSLHWYAHHILRLMVKYAHNRFNK